MFKILQVLKSFSGILSSILYCMSKCVTMRRRPCGEQPLQRPSPICSRPHQRLAVHVEGSLSSVPAPYAPVPSEAWRSCGGQSFQHPSPICSRTRQRLVIILGLSLQQTPESGQCCVPSAWVSRLHDVSLFFLWPLDCICLPIHLFKLYFHLDLCCPFRRAAGICRCGHHHSCCKPTVPQPSQACTKGGCLF